MRTAMRLVGRVAISGGFGIVVGWGQLGVAEQLPVPSSSRNSEQEAGSFRWDDGSDAAIPPHILQAAANLPPSSASANAPAWNPASLGHYLVAQSDLTGCGAIALSVLLKLQGNETTHDRVRSILVMDDQGATTAEQLGHAAAELGLALSVVRGGIETLPVLSPCIVHLKADGASPTHFCVIAAAREDSVLMVDPPHATQWIPRQVLAKRWEGVALVPVGSIAAAPAGYFWYAIYGGVCFLAGVGLYILVRRSFCPAGAGPPPTVEKVHARD